MLTNDIDCAHVTRKFPAGTRHQTTARGCCRRRPRRQEENRSARSIHFLLWREPKGDGSNKSGPVARRPRATRNKGAAGTTAVELWHTSEHRGWLDFDATGRAAMSCLWPAAHGCSRGDGDDAPTLDRHLRVSILWMAWLGWGRSLTWQADIKPHA